MPFRALIREKCGIAFKNDGLHLLEAAITKRMAAIQSVGREDYLVLVKRDEEEIHRLIDLITINETYFFREKQHFDVLCDTVMPELLAARNAKIRILSAGCSTGEEAYSILIALIEKFGTGIIRQLDIHGMDIDRNVINVAREGVYGKNSFRNDERVLMKYFEKRRDHRYHLQPQLRDAVSFHHCNLLNTPYPLPIHNMDVIFYRNVSIYFDSEVQKTIFRNLAGVLAPEGRIFLSSTETYYHNNGTLSLRKSGDTFLYHKRRATPSVGASPVCSVPPARGPEKIVVPRPAPALQVVRAVPDAIAPDPETIFSHALADAKRKRYASALQRVDQLLRLDSGVLKAYALKAGVLLNMQEMDAARAACQALLARDEWNLEAHLLLGIIARTLDEQEEAHRVFKAALYIRSTCWLAHFYLAEIYHRQNDLAGAYREYGATLKLLESRGIHDHGMTYFPLSFHTDQLIHLCRHCMDKISAPHKNAGHSR